MGVEDAETALLQSLSNQTGKALVKKEGWNPYLFLGNEWTALAHIITAVIGSGVLSLAWNMSRLGWIAGPMVMLLFASVSLVSAFLLCNCYKSPDPDLGPIRNGSYLEAVQMILGKRNAAVCGVIVGINFVKIGIVYTITSAICMRAILKSTCYHNQGHDAPCEYKSSYFILLFGLLQIFVSQVPKFRNTQWLSVVAATMSFTYSIIGTGLGLAKILGFGYAAFGNSTPGNLLTGFGFYEPYWLVNFANACVILHLVGGFQVFSQPLFAIVERRIASQFPESVIVHDIYSLKLPLLPTITVNLLRAFFRTAYVAVVTGVGMLFPYFNQVVAVAGAINFWPITIYFPIEMYMVQKNIGSWTAKWVILRVYSIICLIVIVFAFIGSVKGLISARFG